MINDKASTSPASQAWYILRADPGTETLVRDRITARLAGLGTDQPYVLAPVELLSQETRPERRAGYVLVRVRLDENAWNTIRNTPGVTGYIGFGVRPTPFYAQDWHEIPFHQFA